MRLLAFFRQPPEYINFCIAELKSLFALHNIPACDVFDFPTPEIAEMVKQKPYMLNKDLFPSFPFVYLKNQDDELLEKIISRSILIKSFVRVLSEGKSIEELIANVDKEKSKDIIESEDSFCFFVDAHNKYYNREEQLKMIDKFGALPFKGKINLNNPKRIFLLLEDWENNHVTTNLVHKLKTAYFGVQVCKIGRGKDAVNSGYELAKRPYLGPTSTDNDLSFLMANQALIKENDFVLDPFLGTGSLLIPASHFKAACFGTDIDPRVLHGTKVGRLNKNTSHKMDEDEKPDVWLNFKKYGFELPEVIRMDSSNNKLKIEGFFDSILCDPPYGWRASVRVQGETENKIQKKAKKKEAQAQEAEESKGEEEEEKGEYYIATKTGKAEDVIEGLIDLADKLLKINGRLVFLFPVDKYKLEDKQIDLFKLLPAHPNFELVDYTENVVGMHKSRILVTMRKTA